MKKTQRLLAVLMVLVMCISLLPVSALADETEEGTGAEAAEQVLLTEEEGETLSEPLEAEEADPAEPEEEPEVPEAGKGEESAEEPASAAAEENGEEEPASEEPAEEPEEEPAAEEPAEEVLAAEDASEEEPAAAEEPAAEPQEPEVEEPAAAEEPAEEPAAEEPAHEHEYTAVVTEPTCTEKGYTTYICVCGESYVDDYTEPLNHPKVIEIPEVPATETETGKTAGKKCALCEELLEGCEEIPVLEKTVITIVKQPKNAKAAEGKAEFTVTATVNKELELGYQWQRLDTKVTYADEASREAAWKDMEDETSDILKLTGLDEEETLAEAAKYVYRCVLTAGEASIKTEEAKLLVPLTAKGKDTAAQEAKDAKLAAPVLTEAFNSATGVRVSWKAVSGAAKYRLLRKNLTKNETSWSNVGETTELTLIDKTAASASRYTYTVCAIDSKGAAGNYDATGRTCTYIAKADITKLAAGVKGVTVTWSKPAGAKNFRVMRRQDGTSTWTVIAVVEGTSYTDTSAPKGVKLWYTVRGVSMDNKVVINSYNGTGWSLYHVNPPVMTEAFNSATGVRVSWKAVTGAAKYRLLRKNVTKNETAWTTITETKDLTFIDKSAVSSNRYTYTVQCIDANGRTSSAINAPGRTCTYIAMSKITKIGSVATGVKLVWSQPQGAKNFRVMRRQDGTDKWTVIKVIQGTSYVDTTAQKNVKYWYTVRGVSMDNKVVINSYNATGWSIKYEWTANVTANSALNRENILKLLDDYDPDGAFIIRNSNEGTLMEWFDGAATIGEGIDNLDTAVHEQCHMYTHTPEGMRYNSVRGEYTDSNEWIYIGNGNHIDVAFTDVFASCEMANTIPDSLKGYRFDTYVNGGIDMASNKYGVYGLLNEFTAYCWGVHDRMMMDPFLEENGMSRRGSDDFVSYMEFRYYILHYMIYAREHYSGVYNGIVNNASFRRAFSTIDNTFAPISEEMYNWYFGDRYNNLQAEMQKPAYVQMAQILHS